MAFSDVQPQPSNELPRMSWDLVTFTRNQISEEDSPSSKTVKAVLIPDGDLINKWVWIRVPVLPGTARAGDMDELNTDMWMDAGRGSGCTTSDLTNRSLQIDRFPLDEPEDLTHAYTIVVAPQHTVGADVHPVNHTITRLLPDTVAPWRGNVIVFRHGKTASKVMINLEERDTVAVQMILTTAFRTRMIEGVRY